MLMRPCLACGPRAGPRRQPARPSRRHGQARHRRRRPTVEEEGNPPPATSCGDEPPRREATVSANAAQPRTSRAPARHAAPAAPRGALAQGGAHERPAVAQRGRIRRRRVAALRPACVHTTSGDDSRQHRDGRRESATSLHVRPWRCCRRVRRPRHPSDTWHRAASRRPRGAGADRAGRLADSPSPTQSSAIFRHRTAAGCRCPRAPMASIPFRPIGWPITPPTASQVGVCHSHDGSGSRVFAVGAPPIGSREGRPRQP